MGDRLALVTGAPGWLGSRLVEALAGGFRSGAVDLPPEGARILSMPGSDSRSLVELGNVEVAHADLRDDLLPDGLCEGVDTVFHCAGTNHTSRIRDLYRVNVQGTHRVLDAAIRAGVRRFVLVSSHSPAGVSADPAHRFTEDSPPRPYLHYGLSKLQAEGIVREAHEAGNIEAVIVRPCLYYGPHQPHRQTRFFRRVGRRRPVVFGVGDNVRSLSYVDNTVQGLLLAREIEKAAGNTYWIADKRPYSYIEILESLARALQVQIEPLFLPRAGGEAARVVDAMLQSVGVYSPDLHRAGMEHANIAVTCDTAKRDLGYKPEIALDEGMRRSVSWCLQHDQI